MSESGESSNAGNPPPVGDGNLIMAQMLQAMQQAQSDQHAHLVQLMGNNNNNNHGAGGDGSFGRRIKEFCMLGGMKFSGNQDYMEAEKWIQECNAIFARMGLTEVQKQEVAAHQLIGSALLWWESIKSELVLVEFSWAQFREKFEAQFIPESVKAQLAEKFIQLTQGNLTVRQYVNRFNELSRFAPYMIDSDKKKNGKFIRGLNPVLAKGVLALQLQPFEAVYNLAIGLEEFEKPVVVHRGQSAHQPQFRGGYNRGNRNTPYGRDFARPGSGFRGHRQVGPAAQGRGQIQRPIFPALPAPPIVAAVPEVGAVVPFDFTCWTCGQVGHRRIDCPGPVPGGVGNPVIPGNRGGFQGAARGGHRGGRGAARGGRGPPVPPVQARVFAAARHDLHVQGIFNFRNLSLRVLFDTGSTHSFIARSLVVSASLSVSPLVVPICVETPAGGTVLLFDQCLGFKFPFSGVEFTRDMIVLNFEGFQVILGMDWLVENFAVIDCAARTLSLNRPGLPILCHTCATPGDTVMTSFLCSMEEPKFELPSIDVVRDYPEVFEEVLSLPPHRDVEFRIDLLPGTAPITRSFYRMAPKELDEMKRQLDDLLLKG